LSTHPDLTRFDDLAGEARLTLLRHVDTCDACRASLLEIDPSRIFALLSLDTPPAAALDRLSARVEAAIDAETAVRPARRPLYAALSVAAAVLLAVLFGGYLLERDAAPVAPQTAAVSPDTELSDTTAAAIERFDREPVTGVELLDSPSSGQLVNVSVGETQITMIFDEALDI
jgi:hypothetical protein